MSATSAHRLPQNEAVSSSKVVVKGDMLETGEDFLQSAPVMIEWSQKWITRKEKYYFVVFENSSQGAQSSFLIRSEYLVTYGISRR